MKNEYPPIRGQWFKKIKEVWYILDDSNIIDGERRTGEWMWIAYIFKDNSVRFGHIKRPPMTKDDPMWQMTMGNDHDPSDAEMGAVIRGVFEQDMNL
jgi:hypothetical protein